MMTHNITTKGSFVRELPLEFQGNFFDFPSDQLLGPQGNGSGKSTESADFMLIVNSRIY